MTRRPTITAAIITLNEERMLPGLITALDWVDEIVVVDGGSCDATVAIARRAGCRVMEHPFDNYADQRNRAIDLATCDWILSIDADERPTAALASEVCRRLCHARHEAFRIGIHSRIFGRRMRFSGTQDDWPIRLFRRGGARWSHQVHEVLSVAGKVGRLRYGFDHETLPNLPAFIAKMQRYTTLEAVQRVKRRRAPRWREQWISPAVEIFRRLIWKQGCFDGPQGWAFCLLSGVSQWTLARKHRQLWRAVQL
jgi:glycosyltransferase involved in cell wall biosynthesis